VLGNRISGDSVHKFIYFY